MTEQNIYRDIASRTGGSVYFGVVGPVRSGKSTFIDSFMNALVLPAIPDAETRIRTQDALPQSAAGKTVMTTEPKFIPDEPVEIRVGDDGKTALRVRMIDCVGYMIPGAMGNEEEGTPRMVRTPWSDTPVPFDEAAETGTYRVITEHATIGILVTTDGTVCELPRSAYEAAEQRVASELQALGKPFVIVLNSATPEAPEAHALGLSLEEKYHAPVALVSCLHMDNEDIRHILALAAGEFPVHEIGIRLPAWAISHGTAHWLTKSLYETAISLAASVRKTGEVEAVMGKAAENPYIEDVQTLSVDPGTGSAAFTFRLPETLFYKVIAEETGVSVSSDAELLGILKTLSEAKAKYDRVAAALDNVNAGGYGIVMPDMTEMQLAEPEIVHQNGSYGIRLRATAPSVHMIRADIQAEISPIVGTEEQTEEMLQFLMREFEEDPAQLWNTNMFGKSLHALVEEGLHTKLAHMPEDARKKIGETIGRMINEGASGLICILL